MNRVSAGVIQHNGKIWTKSLMLYVYYHIGSQHVRYGDYKKQNTDFCTLKSQMLKIFLSPRIYPRNEAGESGSPHPAPRAAEC
jgi:hypothetical protein